MARGSPSQADLNLIEELAEEGVSVSSSQLERWRARGLLPRVVPKRGSGVGSRVPPHPRSTLEAADCLGRVSKKGVPWQDTTWCLLVEGLPVALESLRESAEWAVSRGQRAVQRRWQEVTAGLDASYVLDPENLLPLAELMLELAKDSRDVQSGLRLVEEEVRSAGYLRGSKAQAEAARTAYALRLAMWGGAPLTKPLVRMARYGIAQPPELRAIDFALPAEKLLCARTLTHRETELFVKLCLALDAADDLPADWSDRRPLEVLATFVAIERLNSPPSYDPAEPVNDTQFASWRQWVEKTVADIQAIDIPAAN
jgi:hypothetical protein